MLDFDEQLLLTIWMGPEICRFVFLCVACGNMRQGVEGMLSPENPKL